jgi:hypothetical protein
MTASLRSESDWNFWTVADERAHQARLAHSRRESKTKRWKLALEIRHRRELAADRIERGLNIGVLRRRRDLRYAVEYLQRAPLWWPQTQTAGDGVDMAITHLVGGVQDICLLRELGLRKFALVDDAL